MDESARGSCLCCCGHTPLAPEALWVGDHIDHLKAKLIALNCDTLPSHCIDVLSEIFAPEVVAHLITSDLGVQYDEALNVLTDEAAWDYGGIIDNTPDFIKKADLYMQLLE
jgi:hypothetical protein